MTTAIANSDLQSQRVYPEKNSDTLAGNVNKDAANKTARVSPHDQLRRNSQDDTAKDDSLFDANISYFK